MLLSRGVSSHAHLGDSGHLDYATHEEGVVKPSERRPHVSEGHLATAVRVDDVLVHVVLVFHNGYAVHEVVVPIRHMFRANGTVLPFLVLRHPLTPAMALAFNKLARIEARSVLVTSDAEVLSAIAMRHVILERAVVGDVLPSFWVIHILRRVWPPLVEALHEFFRFVCVLIIDSSFTAALSFVIQLTIEETTALVTSDNEMRPYLLIAVGMRDVILKLALVQHLWWLLRLLPLLLVDKGDSAHSVANIIFESALIQEVALLPKVHLPLAVLLVVLPLTNEPAEAKGLMQVFWDRQLSLPMALVPRPLSIIDDMVPGLVPALAMPLT
mmetsp:Transcript_47013/g.108656  ORF Transcript_47013/g.108656 Transcript_47013/m.108656 type:complete len:327 (-) Transcript_47013:1583-2563(-)